MSGHKDMTDQRATLHAGDKDVRQARKMRHRRVAIENNDICPDHVPHLILIARLVARMRPGMKPLA